MRITLTKLIPVKRESERLGENRARGRVLPLVAGEFRQEYIKPILIYGGNR